MLPTNDDVALCWVMTVFGEIRANKFELDIFFHSAVAVSSVVNYERVRECICDRLNGKSKFIVCVHGREKEDYSSLIYGGVGESGIIDFSPHVTAALGKRYGGAQKRPPLIISEVVSKHLRTHISTEDACLFCVLSCDLFGSRNGHLKDSTLSSSSDEFS